MFEEDAIEISRLLNLTLTRRGTTPMCGIPYHASKNYIARLLKFGKKIAICEQLSEPQKGSALIERKVIEVITPGTALDEDYLEPGEPNYIGALYVGEGDGAIVSFAYSDISTGSFYATTFPRAGGCERLKAELEYLSLREIIIQESLLSYDGEFSQIILNRSTMLVNRIMDWLFDGEKCYSRLCRQFGGSERLKSFGITKKSGEVFSCGALLDYIDTTAGNSLQHIEMITRYDDEKFVVMDESSLRNLELLHNLSDGTVQYSLLEVLDKTRTGMGRRLLMNRLLHLIRSRDEIELRLDFVEHFFRNQEKLKKVRGVLGKIQDLERLSSRLALDKAHGKDLALARSTLAEFFVLYELLFKDAPAFSRYFEAESAKSLDVNALQKLIAYEKLLESALADDPSTILTEGNLIKRGYNAELDKLYDLKEGERGLLQEYLQEERDNTGIANLKIQYNRLIGYFFEVTAAQVSKVPAHFIKRQGMVGASRYTTDRLISLQAEITGAEGKIIDIEKRLFLDLRSRAKELIPQFLQAASRIAETDCAASLAESATIHRFVRPRITEEPAMIVKEGRHPVVEAHLKAAEFVPNDLLLGGEFPPFILITGPNMAGKSTYLRQCALFAVMAQVGSFVSAGSATIGLVDRIYCRVGAQDNLARGESTFLVEMNETAYILNTATFRSLVIMDEVGRGTSINDGRAIAQAVCEDILDRIGCRTLFATHYHELSALKSKNFVNRSMDIEEVSDGRGVHVAFRRRLKEGPSMKSYGIHVARMAGMREEVLRRAAVLEAQLSTKIQISEAAGSAATEAVEAVEAVEESAETPPEQPAAPENADLPLFA
jgi:DNA mismatch repair protein MutS